MSGLDTYRVDKNQVTIEVHSGPDNLGRYSYTLHWWAPDFHVGPQWRGQAFKAPYKDKVKRWEKLGHTVVVVTR